MVQGRYKDVSVRDNIWREIATKIKKRDEDCRKRWKHIRDSYNRFKRKRKCSTGSTANAKNSKWDIYERLRFLEKVQQERNTESSIDENVDSDTADVDQQLVGGDDTRQQVDDSQSNEKNPFLPPPTPQKTRPARPQKQRDEFLQILKRREDVSINGRTDER